MKKLLTVLLAMLVVLGLTACGKKVDPNAKSEGTMTYAEYAEASEDLADVVVEGYITCASFSEAYGNINLFLQDDAGGYYVYRMPATADDAAKLTVGTKVKVTGQKSAWAGEPEIAEGTGTYEVLEGSWTPEVIDVTDKLANEEELYKYVNCKVAFKGLTVSSAPMYNWDGSGQEGSDVYFGVSDGTNEYSFLVESDEFGLGSDVYTAAQGLAVGDVVNLEGFLYWYNGAQPHISSISK